MESVKRRYRVIRRLPWAYRREWGDDQDRVVVHKPDDVIEVEDGEIRGIFHHLEGLDDDGSKLIAAESLGSLYLSTDFGATWNPSCSRKPCRRSR